MEIELSIAGLPDPVGGTDGDCIQIASGAYTLGPQSGGGASFPSQTGNNGKVLGTDGTNVSWVTQTGGSLPTQTGNSGKFLTTDGTNASWAALPALSAWSNTTPTVTAQSGTFTSASASCYYSQYGKTVNCNLTVTITTVGTASGYISVPLPVTPARDFSTTGTERATGKAIAAATVSPNIIMRFYDATSCIAAGRVVNLSFSYEAA